LRKRDAARRNQGYNFEENWLLNVTCISVTQGKIATLMHLTSKNQFPLKLQPWFLRATQSRLRKRNCVVVKNQAFLPTSDSTLVVGSEVRILRYKTNNHNKKEK
jgi:hypothetical protein